MSTLCINRCRIVGRRRWTNKQKTKPCETTVPNSEHNDDNDPGTRIELVCPPPPPDVSRIFYAITHTPYTMLRAKLISYFESVSLDIILVILGITRT